MLYYDAARSTNHQVNMVFLFVWFLGMCAERSWCNVQLSPLAPRRHVEGRYTAIRVLIPNLGNRQGRMVSLTPWPLFSHAKSPGYQLNKRFGRADSQFRPFRGEINFFLSPEIEIQFLGRSAHSLFTKQTEFSRLPDRDVIVLTKCMFQWWSSYSCTGDINPYPAKVENMVSL